MAGRSSEADALAREAFEAIRTRTDVEHPRADIGTALWYARAAQIAAQAGEREAALGWRDLAIASPALSIEDRISIANSLSAAAAGLGDQEDAGFGPACAVDDWPFAPFCKGAVGRKGLRMLSNRRGSSYSSGCTGTMFVHL